MLINTAYPHLGVITVRCLLLLLLLCVVVVVVVCFVTWIFQTNFFSLLHFFIPFAKPLEFGIVFSLFLSRLLNHSNKKAIFVS